MALAALAREQYGVVGRQQIIQLGLKRHQIERQLQRGRLHLLHRGVYAVGHRSLTHHGRRLAAVLAAGRHAVLSHRTAADLWGIRESSSARIDITAPKERRRPGLVIHCVVLPLDERDEHEGIPVTTPARTLLDLAALLDVQQLARACERAEALRLASPTTLQQLLDRYPRRPGTPKLERLLEGGRVVPTTTANAFERTLLSLLDAENLPRPLVNQPLGHIKPDFRWPEQHLIVELDGFETHGTREAFERDRARDRQLTVEGWRVVRITKRQLDDDPDRLAAELRAMLRPETTAGPGPPRDPRTPAPRSPRAAR